MLRISTVMQQKHSLYLYDNSVFVALRNLGGVLEPHTVINGNTNLKSHRDYFNLNTFCSWRQLECEGEWEK